MRRTLWKRTVTMKVCIGFTFGITAKTVSPTKPRDVDATPEVLICNDSTPNLFATVVPLVFLKTAKSIRYLP